MLYSQSDSWDRSLASWRTAAEGTKTDTRMDADTYGYGVVWNGEIDLTESQIWPHG